MLGMAIGVVLDRGMFAAPERARNDSTIRPRGSGREPESRLSGLMVKPRSGRPVGRPGSLSTSRVHGGNASSPWFLSGPSTLAHSEFESCSKWRKARTSRSSGSIRLSACSSRSMRSARITASRAPRVVPQKLGGQRRGGRQGHPAPLNGDLSAGIPCPSLQGAGDARLAVPERPSAGARGTWASARVRAGTLEAGGRPRGRLAGSRPRDQRSPEAAGPSAGRPSAAGAPDARPGPSPAQPGSSCAAANRRKASGSGSSLPCKSIFPITA